MNSEYWCSEGHFNEDQYFYFKELVNKYNPKYILEIGFCTGRSAFSLLNNSTSIIKFISIDIDFDFMKPDGRIMRDKFTNHYKNFKSIECASQKILNDNFMNNEYSNGIDWVTVDGDHSYNGCLTDLENKYVNNNGIIIVDDYKSGLPNGCSIPSVTKACDDFYILHPELKKTEWYCEGKGFCIFEKQ